jgi:hypothetical protein
MALLCHYLFAGVCSKLSPKNSKNASAFMAHDEKYF